MSIKNPLSLMEFFIHDLIVSKLIIFKMKFMFYVLSIKIKFIVEC